MFGGRLTFVSWSDRWVIAPWHALEKSERDRQVDGESASLFLDSWIHEPSVGPALVDLYEEISGDLMIARTTADVQEWILPALKHAFRTGHLVALRSSLLDQATKAHTEEETSKEEGVVHQGTNLEPPDLPGPSGPRILRRVSEKTFLDVTIVDTQGRPMSGRKFKLQLPNGMTEKGVLGADGRLSRSNIDPGTAYLKILQDEGEPILSEEEAARLKPLSTAPEDPAALHLRLSFRGMFGKPLSEMSCLLAAGAASVRKITDANGNVDFDVPDDVASAAVTTDLGVLPLSVVELEPADTNAGLEARLQNLGYLPDTEEVSSSELVAALEEFQSDSKLSVTGLNDGRTQAKLKEVHGC